MGLDRDVYIFELYNASGLMRHDGVIMFSSPSVSTRSKSFSERKAFFSR